MTLHIANNQIAKIENLTTLDNLEKLKLERNQIKVVEGIKHLDCLKVLNLSNSRPIKSSTPSRIWES